MDLCAAILHNRLKEIARPPAIRGHAFFPMHARWADELSKLASKEARLGTEFRTARGSSFTVSGTL